MIVTFQAMGITAYASEKESLSPKSETDRVIVTLEKGKNSDMLEQQGIKSLAVEAPAEVVTVQVPEDTDLEAFMDELEKDPNIATAEPDYLIETNFTPNDSLYSIQYHHEVLGSERAWEKTMGSSEVTVAVLDDGFDLDHPDLRDQNIMAYNTASYFSEGDHGTHVAGIIGASINNGMLGAGIAPDASLLLIDVFETDRAYTSDVVEGIYLATDAGADVINMSLGSYYYSSYYNSAIQYAHQYGVVIVASAGNDYSSSLHYPSGYTNVISVGSTNRYDELSWFSNYGSDQDIVAPGSDIWSTVGGGGFAAYSGTSMASPIVAGIAALVKSSEPHLTNVEIEDRLFTTAKDLGVYGRDDMFGHGRVDAAGALMIFDIDQPYISVVHDYSTEVTGFLYQEIEDAVITISNSAGEIARQENYNGYVGFSLQIPKQKAGSQLSLVITDRYGNSSEPLEINVIDDIPPNAPVVNEVTDQTLKVTGKAETSSIVKVKAGSIEIGSGIANAAGEFSVAITKQKAGTILSVTATDQAGNTSAAASTTVLDVTAPNAPLVNELIEKATTLSGSAEAGSDIIVTVGTKILAAGKAAADGKFSLGIEPQAAGIVITVVAIDNAGNQSAETNLTVKKAVEPVDRISGTSRYTTAISIAKSGWESADAVILATAGDFPDALAGGPLAYQENAPILLTRTKALTPETKQEIKRLGAKKVIILGSKGAVSLEVEAELEQMGMAIDRIGGKNRFDTAAMIAERLNSEEAVVAFGFNFPDVLSVSAYASRNGIPILLTRTDKLPVETETALQSKSKVHVIGSTGAVDETVFSLLPNPVRYGGKSRYDTALEVNSKLKMGTGKAFVATGTNFPDALAGSVLAAKNNAPILLMKGDTIPEATAGQLAAYDSFSIFGGTGAVGETVRELLNKELNN